MFFSNRRKRARYADLEKDDDEAGDRYPPIEDRG